MRRDGLFSEPYPPAPEKYRNGEFGIDEIHRLREQLDSSRRTLQRHEHMLANREAGDSRSPFARFIMDALGKVWSVRLKKDDNTDGMIFAITELDEDPDTEATV